MQAVLEEALEQIPTGTTAPPEVAPDFADLLRQYERRVTGLCQAMGLAGADIDQAAADVFSQVYESFDSFDRRSAIGTWIYTIAFRTILRYRQKLRRRPTQSLDHEGAAIPADTGIAHPQELEQRERNEIIWHAVSRLPPEQALAVQMHYRDGLSMNDLAVVMGRPVGTVKTILLRARHRLSDMLIARGIEP